ISNSQRYIGRPQRREGQLRGSSRREKVLGLASIWPIKTSNDTIYSRASNETRRHWSYCEQCTSRGCQNQFCQQQWSRDIRFQTHAPVFHKSQNRGQKDSLRGHLSRLGRREREVLHQDARGKVFSRILRG